MHWTLRCCRRPTWPLCGPRSCDRILQTWSERLEFIGIESGACGAVLTPFGLRESEVGFASVDLVLVVVEVDAVADDGLIAGARWWLPAYVHELVVCFVADVEWLVESASQRDHEQRWRTLTVALHVVGEYLNLVGGARLKVDESVLGALGVGYLAFEHLLVAGAAAGHLVVVDFVALDVAGGGRIVATRRTPLQVDRVEGDAHCSQVLRFARH
jgi:hypothetical protein